MSPRPSKRAIIVRTATELFLANGFDRTSMDAVAEHAGVSKTTVYAHFHDKFELFQSIIRGAADASAASQDDLGLGAEVDAETALGRILLSCLRQTTSESVVSLVRVVVAELPRRPDLLPILQETEPENFISAIGAVLERDARTHGYDLPDASLHAAMLFRMVIHTFQFESLLLPNFSPDEALLTAHAQWVSAIFLRGIRPEGTATGHALPPLPPRRADRDKWLLPADAESG